MTALDIPKIQKTKRSNSSQKKSVPSAKALADMRPVLMTAMSVLAQGPPHSLTICLFKKCSALESGRSVTRSPPNLTKLGSSGFRSEINLFVKGRS